jgi:nitrous oxide reductase accessory protein NosL
MGKELVPVVGREAAETFLRDHGGTAIYAFDDVSPERLPAD